MALGIVDRLEVIQVEKDQCGVPAMTGAAGDSVLQAFL